MRKISVKKINFILAGLLLIPIFAFTSAIFEISIDIAPNVLNLSNSGSVVTVHTNLAYSAVQGSSLFLDGVEIDSWKADNRGMFVAKFSMNEIKSLPLTVNAYHTFELTGFTTSGDQFFGTKDILIVSNKGK
ncbi:MAG: hypothetical protein V1720_00335 [bacterium]